MKRNDEKKDERNEKTTKEQSGYEAPQYKKHQPLEIMSKWRDNSSALVF